MVVVRIAQVQLYRYVLPFRRPPVIRGEELRSREGMLVKVTLEDGATAWGEAAPLPGHSRESLADAERELRELRAGVQGAQIPAGLERLDGGFGNWLGHSWLTASVSVAMETAVLQLVAHRQGKSLHRLLCPNPRERITVNALLSGSADEAFGQAERRKGEGFGAFKLKVGRRPFDEDIEAVRRVRETIGPRAKLRLDANRAFDIPTAIRFGQAAAPYDIEYIEEPVRSFLELLELTHRGGFRLPVALDESLRTISPKALSQVRGVRAIVLKPTLLGFEWAMWFARRARRAGMLAVISSAYESSLTLAMLAEIGACLNDGEAGENVAMGLDTQDALAEDLTVEPLRIAQGQIELSALPAGTFEVRPDRLGEPAHD